MRSLDEIVERSLRRAALWEEVERQVAYECAWVVGRPAAAGMHRRALTKPAGAPDPAIRNS